MKTDLSSFSRCATIGIVRTNHQLLETSKSSPNYASGNDRSAALVFETISRDIYWKVLRTVWWHAVFFQILLRYGAQEQGI